MSNFKLPLLLLTLLGAAISQSVYAQSASTQHSLPQLQNTRALIVFAPAADSPAFRTQLQLLERHSFELSMYNTVVVPVTAAGSSESLAFEHITFSSAAEEAAARARFHIAPGDFAVILLNPDGSEQVRSAKPIDIHTLVSRLDFLDQTGPLTASLY
jgi:hypothetical protein